MEFFEILESCKWKELRDGERKFNVGLEIINFEFVNNHPQPLLEKEGP